MATDIDFEEIIAAIGEAPATFLPAILGAVVATAARKKVYRPGMMLRNVARNELLNTPEADLAAMIASDEELLSNWAKMLLKDIEQGPTNENMLGAMINTLRTVYAAGYEAAANA